jgi:hypothetical protein
MKSRTTVLCLMLSLGSGGCHFFGRKKAPAVVTPPAPTQAPIPRQDPVVAPPKQAEPEMFPQVPPAVTPAPPVQPPAQAPAPAPTPHPPKPKPATPTPPPVVQPAPPKPALGQILTQQQQAEARKAYLASSQSARQALARIQGRALTRDQADSANRVRSFLSQAEEAQAKDPATAAQLARRAELLARDLVNNLQ